MGGAGGRGAGGRWSDDEDENSKNNNNNIFKRRGGGSGAPGGGPGGNRFRGERGDDDRRGGNNARAGRGAQRSEERERAPSNRRSSRDDSNRHSTSSTEERENPKQALDELKAKTVAAPAPAASHVAIGSGGAAEDTEEDWDRELQEYDARMEAQQAAEAAAAEAAAAGGGGGAPAPEAASNSFANAAEDAQTIVSAAEAAPEETFARPTVQETPKPKAPSPICTPLYDELPPPAAAAVAAPTPAERELPEETLPKNSEEFTPAPERHPSPEAAPAAAETMQPVAQREVAANSPVANAQADSQEES